MNVLDLVDNTIFKYPIENIEIIIIVNNKESTYSLDISINNINIHIKINCPYIVEPFIQIFNKSIK